jgi:tryptophanyl-tRNA synthetase
MRILTGIQPSGKLHWGNYFGAMQPSIAMQDQGEAFIFIAQYHALTTVRDGAALRQSARDVALDFLACGLDPNKACLFRQADVPEVHELAWLLSTVTPMGLLERCHSYKDKLARGIAASHGLFAYPVLMAADILAYQSDCVPVGRDQKQHVEVTRDIAAKFNQAFNCEVFKMPEPRISESVAVIPGLDGQKMSKSYNNTIGLFDDPKTVKQKIMRIETDSTPLEAPKNPDTCRVFALYKLFANEAELAEMRDNYLRGGYGYGHAKKALLEIYTRTFAPFREKRLELEANPKMVDEILAAGAEKARAVARKTLDAARVACGLD